MTTHSTASRRIWCRETPCGNTLVLGPDDPAPKDWLCPPCEDRIEAQQRDAWSEAEIKRVRALEQEAVHESF